VPKSKRWYIGTRWHEDDFYAELGLAKLISPLRLRGMSAMLTRIKRRLRA
jgi:sulfur transfer protein SufE